MNIKKTSIGLAAGLLLFCLLLQPVHATHKRSKSIKSFTISSLRETIGTAYDINSSVILNGTNVNIHCDSVKRTQLLGFVFQDRQTCKIISSTDYPTKYDVVFFSSKGENCPESGNDQCWYSDYIFATTGEYQLALGGTIIAKPDGTVNIVSFYKE